MYIYIHAHRQNFGEGGGRHENKYRVLELQCKYIPRYIPYTLVYIVYIVIYIYIYIHIYIYI